MKLSLEQADNFVNSNPNASWDIWGKTLTIYRPNRAAWMKRAGRYNRKTNQWGYATTVEVNERGVFEVPRIR